MAATADRDSSNGTYTQMHMNFDLELITYTRFTDEGKIYLDNLHNSHLYDICFSVYIDFSNIKNYIT